MKRLITSVALLANIPMGFVFAEECCEFPDYTFYIKADTGISCSESAHVNAPPSTWEPAVQGYNSSLGNRAIAGFSIGCEFMRFIDLEVGISTRSTFKYKKYQTPVGGGDSYTRRFDLAVTPFLVSVNLLGENYPCLTYDFACGTIYPVLGAGIGVSDLLITNFRTTGLAPTGASAPFESFSSENQHTRHRNFTYTLLIGFEYNFNDCWAISTGYRWFDAGKFKGPRYLRVSSGGAVDVAGEEWKMHFKANEWFVEFKVFI